MILHIRVSEESFIVEYSLRQRNFIKSQLFSILFRRKRVGLPIWRYLSGCLFSIRRNVQMHRANHTNTINIRRQNSAKSWLRFIFFPNVRSHPRLPVARSMPGAKRPSMERDAGSRWVDCIVRYSVSSSNKVSCSLVSKS